jgi:hypothetical protein
MSDITGTSKQGERDLDELISPKIWNFLILPLGKSLFFDPWRG